MSPIRVALKAAAVMPPRWLTLVIVLFWLTTSAVFFHHEFWPYLEPNAPPPFAIDLLDEARDPIRVRWHVSRNGEPILIAKTNVFHNPKANDFTLQAEYDPVPFAATRGHRQSLTITKMISEYRVNPEGQLLGLKATLEGSFELSPDGGKTKTSILGRAQVAGEVTNGQFAGTYSVELPNVFTKEGKLPPVPVSAQGSVLLPLHPINHVRGLHPGQTWKMPLVDPIGDALAALVPGSQPSTSTVYAKVLSRTESLELPEKKRAECHVIEYTNEDMSARTWVRLEDDLVLQQEATLAGETWILQRE